MERGDTLTDGKGWVKIHRELLDKPIWILSSSEQKVILVTLLLMANHKENKWEWNGSQYDCAPGQFVTSLEKIAEKSGKDISIQNVRTAIKRFEKYDFLTNESTKTGRLITIVNWELYQVDYDVDNKDADKDLTNSQQKVNKDLTTNKNDKNVKNEKNEKNKKNNINVATPRQSLEATIFSADSFEMNCVNSVVQSVLEQFQGAKIPNTVQEKSRWCEYIEKMKRLDHRTEVEIQEALDFAISDQFWKSNIRSTKKLREKFDTLIIQARKKKELSNYKSAYGQSKDPLQKQQESRDMLRAWAMEGDEE